MQKDAPWLPALALLAPAGWLLAFGTLILQARLVCGEWPHGRSGNYFEGTMVPESIDPSALGWHSDLVLLSTLALIWIVPITLLFLCTSIFQKRLRQPPLLVATFLVSSAFAAVTLCLDPGGFVNWLGD